MYKLHLILKYLRKRRIAWVSLIAVMLCTAMVLVVISVMGGWLRMFKTSFHGLSGDVIVQSNSLAGFPHYQEMIDEIEKLPEVSAAVPVVQTFGLININNRKTAGVQVFGYPIDKIGKVNEFTRSLWRQYNQPIEEAQDKHEPPATVEEIRQRMEKHAPSFNLLPDIVYRSEFRLNNPKAKQGVVDDVINWTGMITATGVVNVHKDATGKFVGRDDFLYRIPVSLTVMGVSTNGKLDFGGGHERNYWIVDTSRTKVWQLDANTIYVPFSVLQKDLGMDEQQAEQDGKTITLPARTSEIHVRAKQPWRDSTQGLIAVRDKVQEIVERVTQKPRDTQPFSSAQPSAHTWEESQKKWLGAIEKEKVLVTGLFGMISVIAIFLIFCIFYMIVVEKTRDIGIIKSVGATSSGVAGIFLGYGAVIGVVGAGLGLLLGFLVVHNINALHDWLGRVLHVQVWDPEVYAFDTIPNTMDRFETTVIIAIAVIASILGALVPAMVAASKHPVEALRWE